MRRPRIATVVGLALVVTAFLALVGISLTSALVYYVTPTELVAAPPSGSVRLYGIVEPGSVSWDAATKTLSFTLTDGTTNVTVSSRALPTALFRDGIGVVLSGRLSGPTAFAADEILVKHSEVYEPLKPGVSPGLLDTIHAEGP